MTDSHGEENGRPPSAHGWHRTEHQLRQVKNAALEHELDAALAKYASVEPRSGLEERLLANLRAERERAPVRGWWRWPAAGAVAVGVLILAVSLWRKTGEPQLGKTSGHNGTEASAKVAGQAQLPSPLVASVAIAVASRSHHPARVVPAAPRLPQFPSPRPLSEQEEILARYVATYPQHATLVAAARAEALRRDAAEELRDPAGEGTSQP